MYSLYIYFLACYLNNICLWVKDYLELGIRDPLVGDLLDKLLTLDPDKRINTDSALEHEFFWTKPMPCDLSKILSAINISNYS